MIFVTVGTQKFQMNRLMKQIEKMAENMPQERFVIQYGNCTYVPKHCETYQFMDRPQFEQCVSECSVLITHGGVGTIMSGIRAGKPVVVVPRRRQYGEHVDDHQIEAARALSAHKCLVICMNTEFLGYIIDHISEYVFNRYEEPEKKVEDLVLGFIESPEPVKSRTPCFLKFLRKKKQAAEIPQVIKQI